MESQPAALVKVCVKLLQEAVMFVCSYQSKELQAKAVVSPKTVLLMVRNRVTTESQPSALVKVCVRLLQEAVMFVCSYQSNESHAMAVVSPVEGCLIMAVVEAEAVQPVAFSVTITV